MLNMVVAYDQNRGIGKDNKLPWYIKSDLKRFRKLTINEIVVMGKNTFLSLPRPLTDRINIIMTRDDMKTIHSKEFQDKLNQFKAYYREKGIPEYEFNYGHSIFGIRLHGLDPILTISEKEDVFIIGGEQIYKLFLPYTQRVFATEIHHTFDCDTFFPELTGFKEVSREPQQEDGYRFDFVVYEKDI